MTSNFLIISIQNNVKGKSQGVKALHLQLLVRLQESPPICVELGKYKPLKKGFGMLLLDFLEISDIISLKNFGTPLINKVKLKPPLEINTCFKKFAAFK